MEIKIFGNSRSIYHSIDILYENQDLYLGRLLNDTVMYEIANYIKNNVRKHELQDPEGAYDKRIGIVIYKTESGIGIVECGADGN